MLLSISGLLLCVGLVLGYPNVNIQSKIVGGTPATNGAFPYIVSVEKNQIHACGGSVISNRWILTTARCVSGVQMAEVTFTTGINQLSDASTTGDRYLVSQIAIHENYDLNYFQNDIAVIQSDKTIVLALVALDLLGIPIAIGKPVKVIRLATEAAPDNSAVIFAGWGSTTESNNPDDLQAINLQTISFSECSFSLNNTRPTYVNSQICTFTKDGENICDGDYGGPLVFDGKQIGIASWGCNSGLPDVFTDVTVFKGWISEITGISSN